MKHVPRDQLDIAGLCWQLFSTNKQIHKDHSLVGECEGLWGNSCLFCLDKWSGAGKTHDGWVTQANGTQQIEVGGFEEIIV